jgi:predicted double-glycine peptidase
LKPACAVISAAFDYGTGFEALANCLNNLSQQAHQA